jgi:hypothetical protein
MLAAQLTGKGKLADSWKASRTYDFRRKVGRNDVCEET